MADKLKYNLRLPAVGAADVVERRLTVSVVGKDDVVHSILPEVSQFSLELHEGDQAILKLVDIDNAGNESQSQDLVLDAVDTIAPPRPGELAVESVEEVFDVAETPVEEPAPVEPEPVVEEPVVEEPVAEEPVVEEPVVEETPVVEEPVVEDVPADDFGGDVIEDVVETEVDGLDDVDDLPAEDLLGDVLPDSDEEE
jgi:hypothetical protein